ncbi:MAG TPA: hypothetical protein VFZ66_02000 [Herpetosiphonaceae bacterium]
MSQRISQPSALLISTGSALSRQRRRLAAYGFKIHVACSLLTGYTQARWLLRATEPDQHMLVLVDVHATEPGFPELSGVLLVAALARQMRLREINLAWLIGVAAAPTPEQEDEALAVGCQRLEAMPLSDDAAFSLWSLAAQPAPIPHLAAPPQVIQMIQSCQSIAQRMLESALATQIAIWTPEDAALLLRWLTPYPSPGRSKQHALMTSEEIARVERLIRSFGSQQAARQRLEAIVEQWQTRFPLHSEILRRFLHGWERREIVQHFVERRLYEDSRVYACINELPERISAHLNRQQLLRLDPFNTE